MRNRIIALIVIIMVVVAGLYTLMSATSKRNLTITIPDGRQGYNVSVYRAASGAESAAPESFIDPKNLVKELSSTATLSLKQGNYVVANQKSSDYAPQAETVTLDTKPVEITMKASYSDAKLGSLLASERADIQRAVITTIPLAKNYKFDAEKLFLNGDWYGATLAPVLSTEQERLNYVDKYRLIAHKENGSWKVQTSIPDLILSSVSYPNIPFEVLSETNKL